MTTPDFIAAHSIIGNQTQININYDKTGDTTGTITGFTVTVTTKKDWNSTLSSNNILDLTTALQQVQAISFVVNSKTYNLKIIDRSISTDSSGNRNLDYFYFAVTPSPFILAQVKYSDIQVNFEPLVLAELYTYNDYNPIISNAVANRQSTFHQQVDRTISGVQPVNFADILESTAVPAQVQDSNYTSTGWSNARYGGTTTSAETYRGVLPAATGRTFPGEVYSSTVADSLICSRSLSDRTLTELLQTSAQELPQTASFSNPSIYKLYEAITTSTTKLIKTALVTDFQTKIPVEIGSVIKIGSEYLRIESINKTQNYDELTVVRGYLSSTAAAHTINTLAYTTPITRVFKFEGTGAKAVNTANSKIWIKDSKQVLYTDGFGVIYGGSVCSI
jgi:hypothetical protein